MLMWSNGFIANGSWKMNVLNFQTRTSIDLLLYVILWLSYILLQLFVADLRDKMTSISIYVVVTDIKKINNQESTFLLRVEDATGGIWAKLHFVKSWYTYVFIFLSKNYTELRV